MSIVFIQQLRTAINDMRIARRQSRNEFISQGERSEIINYLLPLKERRVQHILDHSRAFVT